MIALTQPRFFIPVHGDFQHLSQHASSRCDAGIPAERIIVIESGDVLTVTADSARVEDQPAPVGTVFIDGTLEEVDAIVIKDRQHIAEDGIVIPVWPSTSAPGHRTSPGDRQPRVRFVDNPEELFDDARQVVVRAVEGSTPVERSDWGVIKAGCTRS